MAKFERPSNHGEDVQHRARPENKNDEQSGDDVEPEKKLSLGNHSVRVLNQNRQGDALNNADERELDLHHHESSSERAAENFIAVAPLGKADSNETMLRNSRRVRPFSRQRSIAREEMRPAQ